MTSLALLFAGSIKRTRAVVCMYRNSDGMGPIARTLRTGATVGDGGMVGAPVDANGIAEGVALGGGTAGVDDGVADGDVMEAAGACAAGRHAPAVTSATLDINSARTRRTCRLYSRRLARLVEHLALRVEPAVWVLLEDELAAVAIELVVAALVAETDPVDREHALANDADRGHQIGSSSRSG